MSWCAYNVYDAWRYRRERYDGANRWVRASDTGYWYRVAEHPDGSVTIDPAMYKQHDDGSVTIYDAIDIENEY